MFAVPVASPRRGRGCCASHEGTRTLIQIHVTAFNVLINLWIIPAYGWRGAVWSSTASDGLLASTLLFIVVLLLRKPRFPAGFKLAGDRE
jgi:O-antigen/teichoic acid export membrane protein